MSNERVLPGLGGAFKGFGDKFSDDWHLWADLNWLQIAVMMNGNVLSQVTSLPGSPSGGEIYIVKVGDADQKKVAVYTRTDYGPSGSAAWVYYVPVEGWVFYVLDEDLNYQFDGTSWVEFGAALNIDGLTEDGSPDGAADFAITYDASAGINKKVLLNNLPGGGGGGGGGGSLIGVQVITSSGTYTPSAGATSIKVTCIGSGAGGGGAKMATSAEDAGASGGSGGSTAQSILSDAQALSGTTLTVGSGGAGGIADPAGDGVDGITTSFGAAVVAGGGVAGIKVTVAGASDGVAGGVATAGDLQIAGGQSDYGSLVVAINNARGGQGGGSSIAPGAGGGFAINPAAPSNAGKDADGYGSGGGGAAVANTATGYKGGDGDDGVIIIEEYGIPAYVINTDLTTAKTLELADAQALVEMDNAAANVLLIPTNAAVAFPIGTVISVTMIDVGVTSITADATVTLNGVSAGSGALGAQFSGVSIYKRGLDEWIVQGDIGVIA